MPEVSRGFHYWQPAPRLTQQRNPAMSPYTKGKEQAPITLKKKTSVEKNPTSLGGGREGKKMAARTLHEGKTERAKESHDRCSQPPGMRMPKTADLGTQALLVVNSFKLHLNAGKSQRGEEGMDACNKNPLLFISVAAGICNLLIGWATPSNLLTCVKII